MSFSFKASVLVVLVSGSNLVAAEEKTPAISTKETMLPGLIAQEPELQFIKLEDAIKKLLQDSENKILTAKTELVEGKKIHVIKVLTPTGHIQYLKIDAVTGKNLDNKKK